MRFYKNLQFEMLMLVALFLKKEQEKLGAIVPALNRSIPLFITKQDQLFKLHSGNINAVAIKTGQKKETRDLLIESLLKLLDVVKAYQSELRTHKEKDSLPYNRRILTRSNPEELNKISLRIIGDAKKIKNIRQFGVVPEDIGDAFAYHKEFTKIKNAPKIRKKETGLKNKQLNLAISDCIKMLKNTIDPLMRIAGERDKELSERYKSMRLVLPKDVGRPSDREISYRESRKQKTDRSEKKGSGNKAVKS